MMGRRLAALLTALLVLTGVQTLRAADLFPTPAFSNHPIPQAQTPAPRASWYDYLDLAFLMAAMAAASLLAVKVRSRKGLFLLSVVSLAWLGFWRKGCVCPIGAIQNVTQALFDTDYVAGGLVIAIFVLPLVFTLFFGRSFCSSVCPLGAVQELVAVRPIQVPTWIDHALGLLAYVYLGAAVLFAATGSAWIICRYDPFVGLFRMTSSATMLALSAAFLGVGLFIGRPYCRWLCPYGAILALLSRVSWRHLRIPPVECVQCRLCEDACPYGAIQRPTVTPSPAERVSARRRLIVVVGAVPILIATGTILGFGMRSSLATLHPTVQLAEQIRLEQSGQVKTRSDATDAFRATGESVDSLYGRADAVVERFAWGGSLLGGWVGLVFGVKLVQLSLRRRRTDYEPDRGACVSCGRCFWYCPEEHTRQELFQIQQPGRQSNPQEPFDITTMQNQPANSNTLSYRIATRTAAVAAIFSLIVASLLVYDFFHRSMKDPSLTPAREALKTALEAQPANEAIQAQIRSLDQESRDEWFRQKAFAYSGAGMLCGGIIVSLVAAKWSATLHRKHPQMLPPPTQSDWEASWTPAARWTVGGLFVVLAATAIGLIVPLHATVTKDPNGPVAAATNGDMPSVKDSAESLATGKTTSAAAPTKPTATAPTVDAKPRETVVAKATAITPDKVPVATAPARPTPTADKVAGISDEELARAWPYFRGRGGLGISPYRNVPDDWNGASGKNIVWKSPVPLIGNSSPVVVAGRIFLTGADENQRQVYCYDAKSGQLLWQRDVPSTPDSRKPVKLNDDTGYAACTMATDGRYVAAIFANGDLAAYDLDGKLAWSQSLGIPDNPYGHAASLSICKHLLLVPFDQATPKAARSKLRALDIATGQTVWEQTRAVPSSWTTPIVIHAANRDQVVTAASPWVIAYDAAEGKELWRAKGSQADVAPSPVAAGNVVFAAANDSAPVLAIRADGSGDVTASHVLWKAEDNTPDICSPLATEDFLFLLTSEGMVTCYDARKGTKLWEEDLNDFRCKSSPSLVGKLLYVFGESGKCWILEPKGTGVKRVRQTDLGEACVASPAFQDGRMIVRGKTNLFCIGQSGKP